MNKTNLWTSFGAAALLTIAAGEAGAEPAKLIPLEMSPDNPIHGLEPNTKEQEREAKSYDGCVEKAVLPFLPDKAHPWEWNTMVRTLYLHGQHSVDLSYQSAGVFSSVTYTEDDVLDSQTKGDTVLVTSVDSQEHGAVQEKEMFIQDGKVGVFLRGNEEASRVKNIKSAEGESARHHRSGDIEGMYYVFRGCRNNGQFHSDKKRGEVTAERLRAEETGWGLGQIEDNVYGVCLARDFGKTLPVEARVHSYWRDTNHSVVIDYGYQDLPHAVYVDQREQTEIPEIVEETSGRDERQALVFPKLRIRYWPEAKISQNQGVLPKNDSDTVYKRLAADSLAIGGLNLSHIYETVQGCHTQAQAKWNKFQRTGSLKLDQDANWDIPRIRLNPEAEPE